jgi:hypothetical protein
VTGLHRCNNTQFLETGHVVWLADLDVLHPVAAITLAVDLLDGFVTI